MAEADVPAIVADTDAAKPQALTSRITGSLARRMIAIAALWISVLLIGGGFALDRVLTGSLARNFDSGLEYVLIAMIRSSEIGPDGEVRLVEPLGDLTVVDVHAGGADLKIVLPEAQAAGVRHGDRLNFAFDAAHTHLFRPGDGAALG